MNLYRHHAENSVHQHAEQKSPRMRKQTYSWAEVAGSILTAIALRLHGIRAVRAQLESMIAQWDVMIDPNNLPEREDCDWREIVKLGKERLQANVNDLNRWLDAPLEEEGTP